MILLLFGFVVIVVGIIAIITNGFRSSGKKPPVQKPYMIQQKGINGLIGICRNSKNAYPYSKFGVSTTLEDAKKECLGNEKCVAMSFTKSYNDTGKPATILFSFEKVDGWAPPSQNWNSYNSHTFPAFPSPYVCNDPLPKAESKGSFCYNYYGDYSQNILNQPNTISPTGVSNTGCSVDKSNWVCYFRSDKNIYQKSWEEKNVDCTKYLTCAQSQNNFTTLISNPYIPTYKLLKTPGNFFFWFYNTIKNAKEYCYIINTYWKIGIYQSEDLDDYQSQIYHIILQALKSGVTFYIVHSGSGDDTCSELISQQIGFVDFIYKWDTPVDINLARGKLNMISTNKTEIGFFHDKIYLTENDCYIGGQNASSSSSIDFGITITSSSPLFEDVKTRCNYFISLGKGSDLKFNYNEKTPYKSSDGTKYFIALSPFSPPCNSNVSTLHNCFYGSQGVCNPPESIGDFKGAIKNVSNEYQQVLNIIKNAKKWIFVTNYELSAYSQFFQPRGTTWSLFDAMLSSAKKLEKPSFSNGVFTGCQLFIYNSAMGADDPVCEGVTACEFFRCKRGWKWLQDMKMAGADVNWWYQTPVKSIPKTAIFPQGERIYECDSPWSDCALLHAKIYYSDYGLLVSSSNFTASYFTGTEDTGFACIFGENGPPGWIKQGMSNIMNLIERHKSSGNIQCLHSNQPNIITPEDKDSIKSRCLQDSDGNVIQCCGSCFLDTNNLYDCDKSLLS